MRYHAPYFTDALKQAGIAAESEKSGSYYDETEIALIVDLLKVIDNEKNDISLLAVMRSFFFSFTADEMLKIRLHFPDALYYHEALSDYQNNGEDRKIREKIKSMREQLAVYRELSKHVSIERLLRKICNESMLLSYVSALADGKQRRENINYLLKLAGDYETATLKGLHHFILYIEKCKDRESSFQINTTSDEEEKVRLLTVHKSKGLEFNIVILLGCGNSFSSADISQTMIFHKELGICPSYRNIERSYSADTLIKTAAKQYIREENTVEEMRILYVAATRAKQRLLCVATMQEKKRAGTHGFMLVHSQADTKCFQLCGLDHECYPSG